MVRQVVWSPRALADLEEIKARVAIDSPINARAVAERIEAAAARLADYPFNRRKIPEFDDHYRRETFVHEWRLMYRIEPDRIRILRVVHGRRLLKNVPGNFEEPAQAEYIAS